MRIFSEQKQVKDIDIYWVETKIEWFDEYRIELDYMYVVQQKCRVSAEQKMVVYYTDNTKKSLTIKTKEPRVAYTDIREFDNKMEAVACIKRRKREIELYDEQGKRIEE